MNVSHSSWNAISPEVAAKYLDGHGHPCPVSKEILCRLLRHYCPDSSNHVLDMGCGNAHLFGALREMGLGCRYTGIDVSEPLLAAARQRYGNELSFGLIHSDVNYPEKLPGACDVAIYSHVLEMIESPESSLQLVRKVASKIIIRFFEPPDYDCDSVELRVQDLGAGLVPYLRRKMSHDHYRLILSRLRCRRVDIYRAPSKDQVHVLHF